MRCGRTRPQAGTDISHIPSSAMSLRSRRRRERAAELNEGLPAAVPQKERLPRCIAGSTDPPAGGEGGAILRNISAYAKLRRGLLLNLLISHLFNYIAKFTISSAQFG